MGGGSSRRKMAVATFLYQQQSHPCMQYLRTFPHLWRVATVLVVRVLINMELMEWLDCMLKIWNTGSQCNTLKLSTTNFISWILCWKHQPKCYETCIYQLTCHGRLQSINVLLNVNCSVELETTNAYRNKWLDKYFVTKQRFNMIQSYVNISVNLLAKQNSWKTTFSFM